MGYIVAIGGGDNGWGTSNYETQIADDTIIELANKKNPVFLFIGFAAKIPDEYYKIMCSIYEKYGCVFIHLDENECKKGNAASLIDEADIIYVGGGNTYKLMCKIRKYGLDRLLSDAYYAYPQKVFCGVSAGAIIWCRYGNSATRYKNNICTPICVRGLNLLNIFYCPHSTRDNFRAESTKAMLKNKPGQIGIEIDYAAIVITEYHYRVIALDKRATASKRYWSNGIYYYRKLTFNEIRQIEDLFTKDGEEMA